ncbi:hypothetical protein SAMN02745784_03224 [Tissierella praeacuta DSM 18095]|uniref:Uncharacterized protein n=1 Tax=Tissierella praeacuta DSM 18095 TaxID=1123404 RepID=A0A1M4ZX15_9FIRM|nr:hypothetical protein [Tissierella praeacuta]SHF22561.1 hypothetical protein SAMN02745784_03224 [Tissierella praeacuta DSM 18095]
METKNKKTGKEWQEIRKNSFTRFQWKDFEKVELLSSRELIDNLHISEFLSKYSEPDYLDIIDIFPLQISSESIAFGDVEQYFYKTEVDKFISKFVRIILKLHCYYPYTNIIVSHTGFLLDHEGCNYSKPMEYFETVMSPVIVEQTEKFINTVFDNLGNSLVSFYFKSEKALITLGSGEFYAVVKMLKKNNEFIDLLKSLVISEGLFLR